MNCEPRQHLIFAVDGTTYGLAIRAVREIVELREITPVPTLPAAVRGVINLRGIVIPVIDMGVRLGRGGLRIGRTSCIIVVDAEIDGEVGIAGLLVDLVSDVADDLELSPPPQFGTPVPPEILTGVAPIRGGVAHVLDLGRVLSLEPAARG
jgi:purine-binding chemotaxis protein CheW